MKKYPVLFLLFLLFLFSCKAEKPVIIDGIDYKTAIIGKWEAISLGKVMEQFNYALPCRFEFKKNGDYYYMFTRLGVREERTGSYELNLQQRPVEITFEQKKPLNAVMYGIIRFVNAETIHTIFYYKNVMTRVYEFKETEIQIYKKVTDFTPQG